MQGLDRSKSLCRGDVLLNMSNFLDALSTRAAVLEETISDESGSLSPITPSMIIALQDLDYLRQSLCDLARLTDFLGQHGCTKSISIPSPDTSVQLLKLDTVRQLLFDSPKPRQQADDGTHDGDIDFF